MLRWIFFLTLMLLGVGYLLLGWDILPEPVAAVVERVGGVVLSLSIPLLMVCFYVIPGFFQGLLDDVHHFWRRLQSRRKDVDELQRKVIQLDKPYHMVQLGSLWANQGRTARAADMFSKALERDPALLDARYHLALCRYDQGRYPEAAELLENVHATKPDHDYGKAYLRLAESCQRSGKLARAAEIYEIFLRYYPGQAEGSYYYAQLLAGQGDAAKAEHLMRELIVTVRLSPGFQRRRNRHWALKARWWLLRRPRV